MLKYCLLTYLLITTRTVRSWH